MKKGILLFLSVFLVSIFYGQGKNKFSEVTNSKKLGMMFKKIKESDKDEYYQQYYWLVRAERLKAHPNLQGIKPIVFYTFVKEITPEIPTKTLNDKEKALRETAEHALNIFFANKDWDHPLLKYNLETYVDPSAKKYYTDIPADKVQVLMPKKIYTMVSYDEKTKFEKRYYLWLKDDKFEFINIFPRSNMKTSAATANVKVAEEKEKEKGKDKEKVSKENIAFENDMKQYMTNFKISDFVPTSVVPGDKRDKKDIDFFYITPFQEGNENIVYKTEDFKNFYLVRYKKNGEAWVDIDRKKVHF